MDTLFDSQDLGESSTNDLQAGEFAKSSPSPVQGLGAATQTTVDLNDFIDARCWRYFRDVVLVEQGFSASPFELQAAIDSRLAVK